jgi:hypothetical protein
MSRSSERFFGWAFRGALGIAFLGATLAGLPMLTGCGPSGVGSVDWADNPKARAVGAPPRLPQKPTLQRGKPSKKSTEFIPG